MYEYAINETADSPVFQINKHIGYDAEDGTGICGRTLSREIFEIDINKKSLLTFFINSVGGDVQEAYDIFNAIVNCQSPTKTVGQGFIFSSAGWIFLAGDRVEMCDYSIWMCHMPYFVNSPEKVSELIMNVANSAATIMAGKSGRNGKPKKTVEDMLNMMRVKTYMTAYEMYEHGLIDKVIITGAQPNDISVIKNSNPVSIKTHYKEYQKIVNKFISDNYNNNIFDMKKINNRLRLAEDTSEDGAIAEIANRENIFNKMKQDKEELENKLKAVNQEKIDLEKRLKEMQNKEDQQATEISNKENIVKSLNEKLELANKENLDMKAEKEKVENKAKADAEIHMKEKAQKMVDQFVSVGKIKDEEAIVNKWVEKAIQDYDGTELILNTLPTNIHVPRPDKVENTEKPEAIPGTPQWFKMQNRVRLNQQEIEREKALKTAGLI